MAGTHSLVWDEAVKISGADPDFHRRDLWEAIESGNFPEWELGVQVFTEEQAERVQLRRARRDQARFPRNSCRSGRSAAWCSIAIRTTSSPRPSRSPSARRMIVRGLDFSNDPLLAGRIHSYVDTQISRLGGPNFHEIPINASVVQVHNNQRDGMHRQSIARGRVSYEPNSLGGGCPFQGGSAGFQSFPQPAEGEKLRGKPERFAEHYDQARLFYNSQSEVEKAHILGAFRFELSRVQTPAIRERMVAGLMNVDESFATNLARQLGMLDVPGPLPRAGESSEPEVTRSPPLSLLARPGKLGIRTRRIAIFVADGVDAQMASGIHDRLLAAGAVPRFIGVRLGEVAGAESGEIPVEASFEAMPSVLFDAVVVPHGPRATESLSDVGQALEFLKDQYRHCKPILALGTGIDLVGKAGVSARLPGGEPDPGLIVDREVENVEVALDDFIVALTAHRAFAREMDPPGV